MRLLSQTEGTVCYSQQQQYLSLSLFVHLPQALIPTGWHEEDQVSLLHRKWIALEERIFDLRDPESFKMGRKHVCPLLWREMWYWTASMPTLSSTNRHYLPWLTALCFKGRYHSVIQGYRNILEKRVQSKVVSALFTIQAEMQETYRELSPNNHMF